MVPSVTPKPPCINENIPDNKAVKKICVEAIKPILIPSALNARKTEVASRIFARMNPSRQLVWKMRFLMCLRVITLP
jgi:hypothetical protein